MFVLASPSRGDIFLFICSAYDDEEDVRYLQVISAVKQQESDIEAFLREISIASEALREAERLETKRGAGAGEGDDDERENGPGSIGSNGDAEKVSTALVLLYEDAKASTRKNRQLSDQVNGLLQMCSELSSYIHSFLHICPSHFSQKLPVPDGADESSGAVSVDASSGTIYCTPLPFLPLLFSAVSPTSPLKRDQAAFNPRCPVCVYRKAHHNEGEGDDEDEGKKFGGTEGAAKDLKATAALIAEEAAASCGSSESERAVSKGDGEDEEGSMYASSSAYLSAVEKSIKQHGELTEVIDMQASVIAEQAEVIEALLIERRPHFIVFPDLVSSTWRKILWALFVSFLVYNVIINPSHIFDAHLHGMH